MSNKGLKLNPQQETEILLYIVSNANNKAQNSSEEKGEKRKGKGIHLVQETRYDGHGGDKLVISFTEETQINGIDTIKIW